MKIGKLCRTCYFQCKLWSNLVNKEDYVVHPDCPLKHICNTCSNVVFCDVDEVNYRNTVIINCDGYEKVSKSIKL